MKKEAIGPKITLSNTGCPDDMPETFTAEINTSRYGLTLNAIASVRYCDPDAPHHATPYRVCRVTDLKPLPNYMDGKRTCVTFERTDKGVDPYAMKAVKQWPIVIKLIGDLSEELRILRQTDGITSGEKKSIGSTLQRLGIFKTYAIAACSFKLKGGAK